MSLTIIRTFFKSLSMKLTRIQLYAAEEFYSELLTKQSPGITQQYQQSSENLTIRNYTC